MSILVVTQTTGTLVVNAGATQGAILVAIAQQGPAGPPGSSGSTNFILVNSNVTLTIGRSHAVDTTVARTLTMPSLSSVSAGDALYICDASGLSETNPITVTGESFDGAPSSTVVIQFNKLGIFLVASADRSTWETAL